MLIAQRHNNFFTKKTSLNGLNIITLTAKRHIFSVKRLIWTVRRPLLAAQGKPLKGHKASLDRPVPEVFTRGNVGLILIYLVSDDDVELNVLRCRADMATRKTAAGVYTPRIEIYSHARSQLAVGDWGLCCSCVRVTSFQR